MDAKKQAPVSRATLGRLPDYLNYLRSLPEEQGPCENISAASIAKDLCLGEVQVRKDLSAISAPGRPRIGFNRRELINSLEAALCTTSGSRAALAGAGKLGAALLGFDGFSAYGLEIAAAFDNDPAKQNLQISGKTVYSSEELAPYVRKQNIHIGIIAVPKDQAQSVCDQMIEGGITAIWNFVPVSLEVPENIIVRQENLALSLAHLSSHVRAE